MAEGGLRERQKEKRKQAIMVAAAHLFQRHGFNAASMEDIAQAAELSVGTVYNYFKSKAEIGLAIYQADRDLVQAATSQIIDNPKTRLEAMADNNTTGAYITAEGRDDWQDFDFAAIKMSMRTPSRVIVESTGGHAFSDPFLPCVVLANEMRHRGGMRAGDLLVTGSFSGFFEVAPDEPVTAEFAGFGSAEATFSTTSTK